MNWDAIGAVAELVGSLAVVLTLLYLVVQLKQSSKIAVAESERQLISTWDDALQEIISNNAEMLPAMKDLSSLEENDFNTSISRMARLVQAHHIVWRMSKLGQVSVDTLASTDQTMGMLLATPGGRAYWEQSQSFWPHAEHVEEVISNFDGPSWIDFFEEFKRNLQRGA